MALLMIFPVFGIVNNAVEYLFSRYKAEAYTKYLNDYPHVRAVCIATLITSQYMIISSGGGSSSGLMMSW